MVQKSHHLQLQHNHCRTSEMGPAQKLDAVGFV